MGCLVSAGGIRESTPPAAFRLLDLGGPSSNHSGSKRDTRDHVVNNPEKKKNCNVGSILPGCLIALLQGAHHGIESGPVNRPRWMKLCNFYEKMVCHPL